MTRRDGPSPIESTILFLGMALWLAIASPIQAQTSLRQPPQVNQGSDDSAWLDETEPEVTDENADAHAWYLLGRSFHNAGDYSAAITSWKRAEKLDFALPFTRYNIAAAYARLGEADLAFDWLNSALDAGFAEVDLLIVDDDLADLRGDGRFARAVLRAYENAEPCTDAKNGEQFEQWTADPGTLERSGFQFATLGPRPATCVHGAGARASAQTKSAFATSPTALE